MRIAFIGFGEAARSFVGSLRDRDDLDFSAFDILTPRGGDDDVRAAARGLGVTVHADPASAIAGANWIISAVTAADSLDAGRSVARAIGAGQVFIDINSVSAGRKQETARLVSGGGAAYVDMAVMAPVHPRGHRTPVLIAGGDCAAIAPQLTELGFDFAIVGADVGAATSIKMLRSLFVKGMEAVAVQTLLAARAAGRFDEVYQSLSASFPQLGWPDFPLYQLDRVARHGVRRAAEMRESAATLSELGFDAGAALATAIADVQHAVGSLRFRPTTDADPASAYAALAESTKARAG